jgi:hypothetical protein
MPTDFCHSSFVAGRNAAGGSNHAADRSTFTSRTTERFADYGATSRASYAGLRRTGTRHRTECSSFGPRTLATNRSANYPSGRCAPDRTTRRSWLRVRVSGIPCVRLNGAACSADGGARCGALGRRSLATNRSTEHRSTDCAAPSTRSRIPRIVSGVRTHDSGSGADGSTCGSRASHRFADDRASNRAAGPCKSPRERLRVH